MQIGIDCSPAYLSTRTGIGNYTYNLLKAITLADCENKYTLYPVFYNFFLSKFKPLNIPMPSNFKVACRRAPYLLGGVLWPHFFPDRLKEISLGGVDIVHNTSFSTCHLKRKKLVVTIYDLTVFTHPECHMEPNISRCRRSIQHAVEHADAIIAISQSTKNDLVNEMSCPPEKIHITHLAADSSFKREIDKTVLEKYSLPSDYILFIGSLEPRKNIKTLLLAYSKLPESLQNRVPLVIAGAKGWLNDNVLTLAKRLSLQGKIKFLGFVPESEINTVYSAATVFVYPSLYEGFGLPILEAMACGTPVITSNISSMPEVAGDAGLLIDPMDEIDLRDKLKAILEDEELRAGLSERGLARSAMFSWEQCARETINVYSSLAG